MRVNFIYQSEGAEGSENRKNNSTCSVGGFETRTSEYKAYALLLGWKKKEDLNKIKKN